MGNQTGKDVAKGLGKAKVEKRTFPKTQSCNADEWEPSNDSESPDPVNNQWMTKENLFDGVDDEENENLFFALYDFSSGGENQLDLVKGEKVIVLEYNETKEWARVEKKNGSSSGWVPSNYIALATSNNKFSWFHGPLSRNAAEYILSSRVTGSFLVRDSESCPGQITLSVRFEDQYYHYKILRDSETIYIAEEQRFKSLDQLIKCYCKEQGLVTFLQYPVHRVNKPTIFLLCPEMEKWEIGRSEIEMKQQLGSGQYGDVYEAIWKKHNYPVAVKILKNDTTDVKEFIKEVTAMKEIKHPNLVQLIGICAQEPPFYIITEFMCNGNLLDFLHNSSPVDLGAVILFYMATQIASAMAYLEEKNFIHRDLAARNCLVGQHHVVKVADFGLARLVQDETYTAQAGCKFPIKWTAPEGLAYGTFSTKTDVWAFGVLLWELATYGKAPYPKLEIGDVYPFLEKGNRMVCPNGCPDEVYNLMLLCWKWDSAERPTFRRIRDILENMFQKSDDNEEVKQEPRVKMNRHPGGKKSGIASALHGHSSSDSVPVPFIPSPEKDVSVKNRAQLSKAGDLKGRQNVRQDTFNKIQKTTKPLTSNEKHAENSRIIKRNSLDETSKDSENTRNTAARLNPKVKSLPPKPVLNLSPPTAASPCPILPITDDHIKKQQFSLKKTSKAVENSNSDLQECSSSCSRVDDTQAIIKSIEDRKCQTLPIQIPEANPFSSNSWSQKNTELKKQIHSSDVGLNKNSVIRSQEFKQQQQPAALHPLAPTFPQSDPDTNYNLSRKHSADALLSKKPPILKPKPVALPKSDKVAS